MEQVGQTLGNYRLEALLGSGGTGQIYRGVHIHLGRPVAVKVLHAQYASDPFFQARFLQEAQAAARLAHPNIVEVLDFGRDEALGRFYLVMELLTNGSVRHLLDQAQTAGQGQPLPLALGVDLIRQAANGLAFAHRNGMVHRDIKPDNLMLRRTPGGGYQVKVTDFGLARLAEGGVQTLAGTTMGTPVYMSPEQCQGITPDGRSDLYSLGVTLYEVTTGYVPFQVRNISEAVYKHVNTPAPSPRGVRPDLSPALEQVILRCLEKKPEDRYASAEEFIAALDVAMPPAEDAGQRTFVPGATPPPEGPRTTQVGRPEGLRVLPRDEVLAINPGQPTNVPLTLINLGEQTETVRVTVEGVDGWLAQPVVERTLPPRTPQDVSLTVIAPKIAATPAGEYPVTIHARSASNPALGSSAPARWSLQPFYAGSLLLEPRGRGQWRVAVSNQGNAPQRYTLAGSDATGRLAFSFNPPELSVQPGQLATAALAVRPAEGGGAAQAVPFQIEARPDAAGAPPLTGGGSFAPPAGPPVWVWAAAGAIVLLVAVAAAVALWRHYRNDNEGGTNVATATTEPGVTATAAATAGVTATAGQPTAVQATASVATVVAATATALVPTATATATATPSPTPAPRYPTGLLPWRAAQNGFSDWQLSGVSLAGDGTLRTDPGGLQPGSDDAGLYNGADFLVGEALSPETPAAAPFAEAIASWDAETPDGTWIETQISVKIGDQWTKFYNLGIWASGDGTIQRHSIGDRDDDADARVLVDTLSLESGTATHYRIKLRLFTTDTGRSPVVRNLGVTTSLKPATPDTLVSGDPNRWNVTLPVPGCTTGDAERSGSATSTAMVLAFWDHTGDCAGLVEETAAGVFDNVYGSTGNWPFNTAYAAATHPNFEAYVVRFSSLAEAEAWIDAGIPLVVSYDWDSAEELHGAPFPNPDGHLGVLIGFDNSGNPILNDPGFPSDDAVKVTYDRTEFETLWLGSSGGMAYIIYPAGTTLPPQ